MYDTLHIFKVMHDGPDQSLCQANSAHLGLILDSHNLNYKQQ